MVSPKFIKVGRNKARITAIARITVLLISVTDPRFYHGNGFDKRVVVNVS
jgi:hypothetical protein